MLILAYTFPAGHFVALIALVADIQTLHVGANIGPEAQAEGGTISWVSIVTVWLQRLILLGVSKELLMCVEFNTHNVTIMIRCCGSGWSKYV